MRKLKMGDAETRSPDVVSENVDQLRALFPEAFTEGQIDFEVLRQLLGDKVDDREEKYGLNWNGKRRARQAALTPSTGTLRPCPGESVDWDSTKNVFIEGDNLEVLKLLQKSYAGKVKLIYIDPPYNTGGDFVYPDDYKDGIRNYLEITGQIGSGGGKNSANTESDGRFHTNWLNMMYPRLRLARNLLRDDGVIAISIDDGEVPSLRLVLDDIFGPENFVCVFAWQRKDTPANDTDGMSVSHEYIVVYARGVEGFNRNLLPRTEAQLANYKNPDNDRRGPWTRTSLIRREGDYQYAVERPDGTQVWPPAGSSWRVAPTTMQRLRDDNAIWWGVSGEGELPFAKRFLSEVQDGVVPTTWWDYKSTGSTRNAKAELKKLFPDGAPFDTPKPTTLIRRLLSITADPNALVLDFFSGSGTTGHAVWCENEKDGGERRFVLVQLPEPTDRKDFQTIAEITKERLRRAGAKIRDENPLFKGDTGFRVFKLDTSNIRAWEADRADVAKSLAENQEHLLLDRTDDDVLYEVLLKTGLDLAVPIETKKLGGKKVHCVGAGTLFVCLEKSIKAGDVETLGNGLVAWKQQLAPAGETTVIFRDSAFHGDDVAKTNLASILEQNDIKNVRSL